MPDPISAVILAGAAGGAGGKFVELAWDSGRKWLTSYYADHSEKAIATAASNTNDFLNRLAAKVDKVEQEQGINSTIINSALEDPAFSVLLRKGLLGAAQTKSEEKHELMAVLLAERLKEKPESLVALAAPLACEAIGGLTLNQLKLLGLIVAFTYYAPKIVNDGDLPRETFIDRCDKWFARIVSAVADAKVAYLDIDHLEALSCAQRGGLTHYQLGVLLKSWKYGDLTLTEEEFWKMPSAVSLQSLWNDHLKVTILTSIGTLIGVYVLQVATGQTALLDHWKKEG